MERYDSYKDSGVEWIGEIPSDWNVYRIKKCLEERKEKNNPIKTDFILSLTNTKGVIPYSEKGDLGNKAKEDPSGYYLAYPDDIVLNSMNVVIGSVGLSYHFGAVSPVYYMLYPRSKRDDVRYYNYIFQMSEFQHALKGLGNGILEIRMRIPMSKLNNVLIPIPSSREQQRISDYLDQKTSQIDSLIEKNEKSIELLEEYRKSVISEAVTKGLDPNVSMKDSGVEWIGEIPEGWHIARFKQVISSVDASTSKKPDNVIMLEDIESWTGKLVSMSDPSDYKNGGKCFRKNDVLFSKLRPYLAKVVYAPFSGVCSGEMLVLRSDSIDHKFLQYHLLSHDFIDEINAATYGAKMPRASWDIVGETQIAFPSLKEQKQIVSCLNEKTSQIDSLIDKKKQLIKKLQEYRKSLISECVTGKIKVSEVG